MSHDPDLTPMNVSLPQEQRDYVVARVASGDFDSVSEYIGELVREDQRRHAREELREKLLEGIESGPATEMTAEDWQNLRDELAKRYKGRAS